MNVSNNLSVQKRKLILVILGSILILIFWAWDLVPWVAHTIKIGAELRHRGAEGAQVRDPSQTLSIYGTLFRIPDREAKVFPSNYESPEERHTPIPKVTNFTLCTSLPDLGLHGDPESRVGCMGVGNKPSSWMVLDVLAYPNGPLPRDIPGETVLGAILKGYVKHGVHRLTLLRGYDFEPDEDAWGLHVFIPKGPHPRGIPAFLWSGANINNVSTLIRCNGYKSEWNEKYKQCEHKFFLPVEEIPNRQYEISLNYRIEWLPQWQGIETQVRDFVLNLRVGQSFDNGDH